ncbi:MAG: riboflavin synthase [bacterium]
MFSGIVAETGRVAAVARAGGVVRFTVEAPTSASELEPGASVAVNGACQTVTAVQSGRFTFDSVAETLAKTNLGRLRQGSAVNLELALRLGDRISGHLVSGHVDSTGVVRARRVVSRGNWDFAIQVPEPLKRYVRDKGSICLDGVSLTVKAVRGAMVEVTVVPFTLENTIIKDWRVGSVINVEVDQLAKYVVSGAEGK